MSSRAKPYDNAWTESLIGPLKAEIFQGGIFRNTSEARIELFSYIDFYYNSCRNHSSLGYLMPN